jgi:hypothetical protein
MLIHAQNSNKPNYKIQDYFVNRQIKEDVKCNSLPCFLCIVNSARVISIQAGAFKIGICDLVSLFVSINASNNSFIILYKFIIFWICSSHWLLRGSRLDIADAFQIIYFFSFFSPSKIGDIISSNWQSAKIYCKNISS